MIIRVSEIPPEGRGYKGEEQAAVLELDAKHDIHVEGPISYDFYAQTAPGELIVRGSISVTVSFRCSRCAESFEVTVKEPRFASVREADRDQSVDLTDEMREAIILAFPNYPVCKPDCKGLCARCGVSLNREKCNCSGKSGGAWAALDGLELK